MVIYLASEPLTSATPSTHDLIANEHDTILSAEVTDALDVALRGDKQSIRT